MLDVAHLSVSFGGVRAVDDVSFSVGGRELVGVVGPNGSGKTTLMNALNGVVPATGTVLVEGRNLQLGRPEASRRAGLVRVFQTPQTFAGLTCLDNVMLSSLDRAGHGLTGAWLLRPRMAVGERRRREAAFAALDAVGLASRANDDAALLTYGEQRVLELARALAGQPRLLMLDEPSAGLNDRETAALVDLLRAAHHDGLPMLLIDHKIDFVDALCDRLVVLEVGRAIAEGPPAEIWRSGRVRTAYLGLADDA